jgi:hypothetical protein
MRARLSCGGLGMDVDRAKDVDNAKNRKSHERCDRVMSQFTSQWDDLKKEIGLHWTAPPKAARPSGARARETESQTRKDPIGFGSSGWMLCH